MGRSSPRRSSSWLNRASSAKCDGAGSAASAIGRLTCSTTSGAPSPPSRSLSSGKRERAADAVPDHTRLDAAHLETFANVSELGRPPEPGETAEVASFLLHPL